MTTRELIHAQVDRLSDDQLNNLWAALQQLMAADLSVAVPPEEETIWKKLHRIQIDGPEDLSTTYERYMGGPR